MDSGLSPSPPVSPHIKIEFLCLSTSLPILQISQGFVLSLLGPSQLPFKILLPPSEFQEP